MMKSLKAGFTLAEVLVTLMVIGVVAAMTIPTLISNTDNKQDEVATKKIASVLSNAVQLAGINEPATCNLSTTAAAGAAANRALTDCMANYISGTITTVTSGENTIPSLRTTDGMILWFYAPRFKSLKSCGQFFASTADAFHGGMNCGVIVDVNGSAKGNKAAPTASATFNPSNGFGDTNPQLGTDLVAFSLSSAGVRPVFYTSGVNPAYKAIYGKVPASSEVVNANSKICCSDGSGEGDSKTYSLSNCTLRSAENCDSTAGEDNVTSAAKFSD